MECIHIAQLEAALGLPDTEFYISLVKRDDDWSFIIKLSALVEASCNYALCYALDNVTIMDEVVYMDLANAESGKIKLLTKLQAITKEQAETLRNISRNKETDWLTM